MSAPKRIWAFDYDLQDETGDWKTWQTWTEELPSPFQATEYRRADLPPTDAEVLAHPKVKALVEALREYACNCREGVCEGLFDCGDSARAALAAIQEAKL